MSGLFFKLAAAPFHFWAPDVYDGSTTTTMLFLTTLPKISLLGLALKLILLLIAVNLYDLIFISGLLSVIVGSLGGLFQKRIKRLFAYSSINNTGFLLLAVAVWESQAYIVILYLVVYIIINGALFLILLFNKNLSFNGTLLKTISSLSNFFYTEKVRAIALVALIFSSAGLPPFIGFLTKFLVLSSLYSFYSNWIYIVIPCLIMSTFSVFYYLRIIKVMAFNKNFYVINIKSFSIMPALVLAFMLLLSIFILVISDTILTLTIVCF